MRWALIAALAFATPAHAGDGRAVVFQGTPSSVLATIRAECVKRLFTVTETPGQVTCAALSYSGDFVATGVPQSDRAVLFTFDAEQVGGGVRVTERPVLRMEMHSLTGRRRELHVADWGLGRFHKAAVRFLVALGGVE